MGLGVSAYSNLFINHASCIQSLSCLPFFLYHPYMPLFLIKFAGFLYTRLRMWRHVQFASLGHAILPLPGSSGHTFYSPRAFWWPSRSADFWGGRSSDLCSRWFGPAAFWWPSRSAVFWGGRSSDLCSRWLGLYNALLRRLSWKYVEHTHVISFTTWFHEVWADNSAE